MATFGAIFLSLLPHRHKSYVGFSYMKVLLFLFEKKIVPLDERGYLGRPQNNLFPSCVLKDQWRLPEVPEAFLVFGPGVVEADRAIQALLDDGPPSAERLHVAEDLERPVAWVRGDAVHAALLHLQHVVVGAVPRGHHV